MQPRTQKAPDAERFSRGKKVLRTQPDRIVPSWKYSGVTGYHQIPPMSTTLPSRTLNELVKTVENIQIVQKDPSSITHVYLFESFRY